MRRKGPTLDADVVHASAHRLLSYQINTNNTLQLRAFLLNETGVVTHDGHQKLGSVCREDIDESTKRQVSRGSSGTLFWAKLKDATPVALKQIPITSKPHRDEVDRELSFFSCKGSCPFVMTNLGAFWDAQDNCIVIPMEWMAFTLKDLSQFWEGVEESILRSIFFQVVSGLRYLHDTKRVIHRDIKPSNILIRADGYVKIGDFGVSKLVQTLDVSSTYVGTMYFMAPERLEESAYSFSSDVWSLGLTIISTVTGRNPWAPPDELNLFQLLRRISGSSSPALPSKPAYSRDVDDFVGCCLRRDPEKRPTCQQLLSHPFLKDCTEREAVENVKVAVDYMSRLLGSEAKRTAAVGRAPNEVEQEVHAKLDQIGNL